MEDLLEGIGFVVVQSMTESESALRNAPLSSPARVVAPMSVNGLRW